MSYHSHIVTRGSMKDAHNLDDRQERMAITKRETKPLPPVSSQKAQKIGSNIEELRRKLAAMSEQEKANRF